MKIKLLLLLIISYALAAEVVIRTFDDYVWNWVLWVSSSQKMINCNLIGLWGLYFFNDNGLMAEKCYKFGLKGARASFNGYKMINRKEGKYLDYEPKPKDNEYDKGV